VGTRKICATLTQIYEARARSAQPGGRRYLRARRCSASRRPEVRGPGLLAPGPQALPICQLQLPLCWFFYLLYICIMYVFTLLFRPQALPMPDARCQLRAAAALVLYIYIRSDLLKAKSQKKKDGSRPPPRRVAALLEVNRQPRAETVVF
jgi:hypothetical protein